ncbi:prorelaxin H1 [Sinocyclocheilus anshuiensis]|uniref:prorelaxin H1 n=1 Tax=Sinocyclocheilus anshuiensis TaxID=1608454 RepID=UPI0007B7DCD4|nr:PREDICTED: relaxin-3-like [Sinocyclocheilus anshuiensis]
MANDQKPAARGTSAVFSYKLLLMFVLKMFRVFSAVLLVCVCVSAERPDLPRDFGVKLCGREFIRAVIFTCGGSRWRRSAQGPGTCSSSSAPEQHLHLLHLHQHQNNIFIFFISTRTTSSSDVFTPSSSSSVLLVCVAGVLLFQAARDTDEEPSLPELLPVVMSDRPEAPDRRKRNLSLGLAGMCCNQGCTKNDIGLLC